MTSASLDSSTASLTLQTDPSPEDIQYLEEGIYEFNIQATGTSNANELGLFVRASDGLPLGGAFGWAWEEPATSVMSFFRRTSPTHHSPPACPCIPGGHLQTVERCGPIHC